MQRDWLPLPSRAAVLILACLAHTSISRLALAQGASDTPHNYAPGIIVMSPVSDNTQNHLRLAASFMVTGNLPASTVSATAIMPNGERVVLRQFPAEGCFVRYSYTQSGPYAKALTQDSCSPTSYPLTGFDLPIASLPVGTVVEVSITPARLGNGPVRQFRIRTGTSIRGIEQSTDRLHLNIAGVFNPNLSTYIYFGLWPVPVRPEAVTVLSDQIVIDLSKHQDARRWTTDLYAITVYQQGTVCDTVLMRFRAPLDLQ